MLAVALTAAAPAVASSLPEAGVTREHMVQIMTQHGLPARIDKDSNGNVIIKSRVASINFDVYFSIAPTPAAAKSSSPPAGRTAISRRARSTNGTPPSVTCASIPSPARSSGPSRMPSSGAARPRISTSTCAPGAPQSRFSRSSWTCKARRERHAGEPAHDPARPRLNRLARRQAGRHPPLPLGARVRV